MLPLVDRLVVLDQVQVADGSRDEILCQLQGRAEDKGQQAA